MCVFKFIYFLKIFFECSYYKCPIRKNKLMPTNYINFVHTSICHPINLFTSNNNASLQIHRRPLEEEQGRGIVAFHRSGEEEGAGVSGLFISRHSCLSK